MKKNIQQKGVLALAGIAIVGGGYALTSLSSENSQMNVADLTAEHNLMKEESNVKEIEADVLSQAEEKISNTLDISSLKTLEKKGDSEEITDITEHKSIETTEIFGVTRTDLSFRIKQNIAIGGLSFDKVYAQKFLLDDNTLNTEEIEQYISDNISFSTSGKTCPLSAKFLENNEEEERLFEMYDNYSFEITATCQNKIENASVQNHLFTENERPFAQFVSLYTRKRTSVINLKSLLLTPEIPTLEWNTTNEIPNIDSDGDGLLDAEEEIYGTDINISDSDGDGDSDYKEIERGTNPLVPHTY